MFATQKRLVAAVIDAIAADPRVVPLLVGNEPRDHRLFCTGASTQPHIFPSQHEGQRHELEVTLTLGTMGRADVAALAEHLATMLDNLFEHGGIDLGDHVLIECDLSVSAVETVANQYLAFLRLGFEALTIAD